MSTITHTYEYDFSVCMGKTNGSEVDAGSHELFDTKGETVIEGYKNAGRIPPELKHNVESEGGSRYGTFDHVIVKWIGGTVEGVTEICEDLNLSRPCVLEIRYEADYAGFYDEHMRRDEDGKVHPDEYTICLPDPFGPHGRHIKISIGDPTQVLGVIGSLTPVEFHQLPRGFSKVTDSDQHGSWTCAIARDGISAEVLQKMKEDGVEMQESFQMH